MLIQPYSALFSREESASAYEIPMGFKKRTSEGFGVVSGFRIEGFLDPFLPGQGLRSDEAETSADHQTDALSGDGVRDRTAPGEVDPRICLNRRVGVVGRNLVYRSEVA